MDKNEFPTLEEATNTASTTTTTTTTTNDNNMEKSTLGSSWAEVVQPHSENAATVPKNEQQTNKINHDPNAWAENKQHATYAEVVEHEEQQSQEFPTPQESLKQTNTEPLPASGGVGDLLNDSAETTTSKDSIQPPNPNRSFADVASNKDFPKPQHDMNNQINQDQPPLSDIPDVNDMLQQPSVHVPPVPPSQSFAKVAAKEIPPENQPLSDRTQELIKNQLQEKEDSLAINDDNFPTLAQSNLMAEEKADKEEKAMYSEISRFNQVGEEEDIYKESNVDSQLKKSFADVTGSNLENAPPPAVSHVDQHPVYDEETVYLERAKQDERKHLQTEQGNNEQLIEEEKLKQVEPTKEQKEQEEKENKVYEKSKEIVKEDKKENENSIVIRLEAFDKHHTGRITIFQTMYALYTLGYSWFCIIPGAILMHLRLSPMTSPYHFPFIYRSPFDLILLPIYTKKLQTALTYNTPIVHQNKEQVDKIVKIYGHQRGLGYWDGIRALRYMEKDTLRWWQVGLWAIHRIQWTLIYTMLHEPESSVVTEPTLLSLVSKN